MAEVATQAVVYRARAGRGAGNSDALVLLCSDGDFQAAFQEFLSLHLKLERWDAITVPGGAYMLSFADVLPKQLKVGMRMLKAVMKDRGPSRIVLIGHDGCSRYLEAFATHLTRFGFSLADKQRRDLRSVCEDLQQTFRQARVEAYFASSGTDGAVEFERL
jgi:hypothetical protein